MKYVNCQIAVAAVVLAACTAASATPAPWYQWRSRTNGTRVCAQNMPGKGWEKEPRPYKDSRCEKLIVAK